MVCFLINPVLCWSLTVVEHVFEGEKGEGGGGENQECVYVCVCVWGGGVYRTGWGEVCVALPVFWCSALHAYAPIPVLIFATP